MVGRGCVTDDMFTSQLCANLGLPHPERGPGEPEPAYLIRRLDALKWVSRQWAHARLEELPVDELHVAAIQICNQAADYAQDLSTHRSERMRLQMPRADRARSVILEMHHGGARARQIAYELDLEQRLIEQIIEDDFRARCTP